MSQHFHLHAPCRSGAFVLCCLVRGLERRAQDGESMEYPGAPGHVPLSFCAPAQSGSARFAWLQSGAECKTFFRQGLLSLLSIHAVNGELTCLLRSLVLGHMSLSRVFAGL